GSASDPRPTGVSPGSQTACRSQETRRPAVRRLRVLMWVVIVIEVPVYLVWLVQVGHQAGQQLPRGDVARWAPPVLLPPAAVLFCVMAGWTWRMSVVAQTRSPLRERWIVTSLVFVVSSVFCGVASGFVHDNGFWLNFCLRREALLVRVEVEDLHQPAVAAAGLKLRAA
ncbi:hypothetical protein, partial [Streptomyces sp. NPDC056308]|uniref:hypothetical protein n=1 Tax=Streptomyces sp. NPDC056308 TaxID=3345780 RepID=UPI0035D83550